MSSIVIKVGSLIIKTLSKPIANRIKAQAREHERFRRVCVNVAQGIHRWDMRFRLGLLQDTAAIEKQIAKDAAEAKKPPTVKTEAQTKADEARAKDPDKGKEPKKKPKIRPLSEAKAIDLGANFVSETFLLSVGIALILFENARRERQQTNRREDIVDQIEELQRMNKLQRRSLVELDKELIALRSKSGITPGNNHSSLPKQLRQIEEEEEEEEGDDEPAKKKGWLPWIRGLIQSNSPKDESPELAVVNNANVEKEGNATSPAPAASTTILSKMLRRSRPEDNQPRTTEQPRPSMTAEVRDPLIRVPKDGIAKASKEQ